jgi:SOS-response transcriptional repressor LexA
MVLSAANILNGDLAVVRLKGQCGIFRRVNWADSLIFLYPEDTRPIIKRIVVCSSEVEIIGKVIMVYFDLNSLEGE